MSKSKRSILDEVQTDSLQNLDLSDEKPEDETKVSKKALREYNERHRSRAITFYYALGLSLAFAIGAFILAFLSLLLNAHISFGFVCVSMFVISAGLANKALSSAFKHPTDERIRLKDENSSDTNLIANVTVLSLLQKILQAVSNK